MVTEMYEQRTIEYSGKLDVRARLMDCGADKLSDMDLLQALLGSGGKGKKVGMLAGEILAVLDASRGSPDTGRLIQVKGIGQAKTCLISAALELGRRLYGTRERRVNSPADVHSIVAHWADRIQERFITLTLNGAHELINSRVITVGLVNRTVVHPREVFADAVSDRACALIIAHNHPSGRLEPSPEDMDITKRLQEAGKVMGISLLDHVIFTQNTFCSFVEKGFMVPEFD